MEVGLIGLFLLLGLPFLFEGYQRRNYFMLLTGAVLVFLVGADMYINGIKYPSGAFINETVQGQTQITYEYREINNWILQAISFIFMGLGLVSSALVLADYYSQKKGELG